MRRMYERLRAEPREVVRTHTHTHMNAYRMYERLRAEPRTVVQRSPIHNLGLFCTRDIDKHDMVIEYVGELVRPVVGDIRDDIAVEKGKSTYMFRLDEGNIPWNIFILFLFYFHT
jgi:SET domain-containing protein